MSVSTEQNAEELTAAVSDHVEPVALSATRSLNTLPLTWLLWLSVLVLIAAVFILIAWNNGVPTRP